jgi:hypothetical protein
MLSVQRELKEAIRSTHHLLESVDGREGTYQVGIVRGREKDP